MIFDMWLVLLILAFLFYFIMKSCNDTNEIWDRIFYGLLSFALFIITALEAFTLGTSVVSEFEAEALAYLLGGFSWIPFIDALVHSIMSFNVAFQRKGV